MDKPLFSYINWGLVVCIILLFGVGELNLYSASGARMGSGVTLSDFYQRQFIWGLCGLGCMLLTMSIDYHRLRSLAWPFYIITLVLLALVPLIGTTVYGAKRWISLGFMSLQPSELAKISVFLLSARLLSRNGEPLGWKEFGSIVLMGLVPAAFIIKQPDLGSALMLLLILAGMILFHGIRKIIFKICALAAPCLLFLMWNVGMHDYQRQRILTFLNPDADPLGTGYHILQSRIAIGSGQMWGKGFTEGTQSQLRFLPDAVHGADLQHGAGRADAPGSPRDQGHLSLQHGPASGSTSRTLRAVTAGSIRRIILVRVCPGPISQKVSKPSAIICRISASHRTGETICRASRSAASSVYGRAVRFEYRGISPCLIAVCSRSCRKALAACSM